MSTTTTRAWAELEFGAAELGDERRTRRLVKLAGDVAHRPGGTVTATVEGSAEREGAFRFLENRAVDAAAMAAASHRATLRRAGRARWIYVPVDQSTVSVMDHQCAKGLGKSTGRGHRRGLQVMTGLAVARSGVPLGLLGQHWWRRQDDKSPDYKEDKRPAEQRESDLWLRVMRDCCAYLGEVRRPPRPWFQLDRGGDFWRVFEFADQKDVWLTVRSAYDRRLAGTGQRLWETVRREKVAARWSLQLPARRYTNESRRARTARLAVRFVRVTLALRDDEGQSRQVAVTAVHVRERHAKPEDRIEWLLLTTFPVSSIQDALCVVEGYGQRWKVEEFHRCWKSGGCKLESSQLRSRASLIRWATLLAAVAARTERLKQLARQKPGVAATSELSRAEIDAAIILSRNRKFTVGQELTLVEAVTLIAEVGGYTGKSSGGPPGSTTLRRGLELVTAAAIVAEHNKM